MNIDSFGYIGQVIIYNIDFVLYVKVLLALLLGALIGAERYIAGKSAGMRTFGLVAMASAMIVGVSLEMLPELGLISRPDILRVVEGVMTGIGFLGAGIIIFRDSTVTGFTTAAGVWVAAGIGAAVGLGFFGLAVFTTFLTLIVFTVLWRIEHGVVEDIVGIDIDGNEN